MSGNDDKAERLAAALRANLRRRKAQARGAGPTADDDQKSGRENENGGTALADARIGREPFPHDSAY
jgi:hypothetical protein